MVAAPHKPRRCLLRFLLPSRLALLDGLLELQYSPPTPRPTGTTAQLERYFYHPSAIAPPCSMANQQPTGSPWNSPAGKTPYYGAQSNAPAGGYANTAPGAAYNHAGAGATAPAVFTLTPSPQGVLRLPNLDLSTHPPKQGPRPWSHKLSNYAGRAGPSVTRSHLYSFPAWNHICPSSARNHLRPPSTRSHIRPSSARSH